MDRNVFTADQEKWLAALESGLYQQCRREMHDRNGAHCCLGVAAIVLNLDERWNTSLDDSAVKRLEMRGNEGALLKKTGADGCLTNMNDRGQSFAQIAAFIRANPWQAFTNFDVPTPEASR